MLVELSNTELNLLAVTLYNEYEMRGGIRYTVNGVDVCKLENKLRELSK